MTRVEAFSDAVFAFALTLLVVSTIVKPMSYMQLSRASAIYALGFVVLFAFLSPMCFGLMGPVHWLYGTYRERRRQAFERQVLPDAALSA